MSKFVLTVILVSVVVLGGLYFVGSRNVNGSSDNSGSDTSDKLVGAYELSSEKMDLGEMKVDEEKTATFNFKNTSTEKMSLGSFETSCNCTMASVKIGTRTSPMFNMRAHMSAGEAAWKGDLEAGEVATIQLTYKPALMPVYGPIERYATFKIDNSKEIRLTVAANVK